MPFKPNHLAQMLLFSILLTYLFLATTPENVDVDKFQLQQISITHMSFCGKSPHISCENIKGVMEKNVTYFCTGEVSCNDTKEMNIFITGSDSLMLYDSVASWKIATNCKSSQKSDFVGDFLFIFTTVNELVVSSDSYEVPWCGMFNFTLSYLRIFSQTSIITTTEPCPEASENYKGDFYSAIFGLTLLGAVLLLLILYIALKLCCFHRICPKKPTTNDGENYEDISTLYGQSSGSSQHVDVISNFYEIPQSRRVAMAIQTARIFSVVNTSKTTESTSASEACASPTLVENKMYNNLYGPFSRRRSSL